MKMLTNEMNICITILYFYLSVANCVDLSEYGFSEDYYVSNVAVYRNRAFFALPRSQCNNNISKPTFVEVLWPEDVYGLPALLETFGLRKKISTEGQTWGNCKELQDVISLDVEPLKPNLWVLDKGNEKCSAKIVCYGLFYNSVTHSCNLYGIPQNNLNTLLIDPKVGDNGLRAYIGDIGDNILLTISLNELKWWKIKLVEESEPYKPISAYYMAISKIEPKIYLSGYNSTELFELNINYLRNNEDPLSVITQNISIKLNVTLLGDKLGISRGLETDYKSGLNYYLVNDFAVARWDTGKPLVAEYHDILAQSYQRLPYVSQIFTGPQNNIWALVNYFSPETCSVFEESDESFILKNRIVKLLKYNRFLI